MGNVDPRETKVDMERLGIVPKEKKKVRVPKIKIITNNDLKELQSEANSFLASVCTKDGFEFNDFRWRKVTSISYCFVGTITYSYLEDIDKIEVNNNV